jgi:hypothetical protein
MTGTPDLLGRLASRQQPLPMIIPRAGTWCPARNCPKRCGPADCTCGPCHRKPCCQDAVRASRANARPAELARSTYQPSLFTQTTKEATK